MNMRPILHPGIAVFALAALAACAQSPDAIAPVNMGNAFAATACRQAQADLITERQRLAALSAQQQNAVAGDAIGVFLIGVPMASLTGGDKAGLIAASKGRVFEDRKSVV